MTLRGLLLGILPIAIACTSGSLPTPVVLRTRSAEPQVGYEAARAAVRAQGYPVVVDDPNRSYLQVRTKTGNDYIGIQALPGVVDIFVQGPDGRPLATRIPADVRRQMERIARGIGRRTPLLSGTPLPSGMEAEPLILEPPLP